MSHFHEAQTPEDVPWIDDERESDMSLPHGLEMTEPVPVAVPVIKLICAWCQRLLRDGTLPASHGICPDCQKVVFKDYPDLPDNKGEEQK